MDQHHAPMLYGWLALLRLLADRRAASVVSAIAGASWDTESVRSRSRAIVAEYLDENNPYDWTDDALEVSRIEDSMLQVVGPSEVEHMREIASTLADDDGNEAAIAWSRVIKDSYEIPSDTSTAKRSRRPIDVVAAEFLRAIADDPSNIAPDAWDEWFRAVAPDADPATDVWRLKVALAHRTLLQRLRRLSDEDKTSLREAISTAARDYSLPVDLEDRLKAEASMA